MCSNKHPRFLKIFSLKYFPLEFFLQCLKKSESLKLASGKCYNLSLQLVQRELHLNSGIIDCVYAFMLGNILERSMSFQN